MKPLCGCFASGVLKNDKNYALTSALVALGVLSEKVINHVNALFLKVSETKGFPTGDSLAGQYPITLVHIVGFKIIKN